MAALGWFVGQELLGKNEARLCDQSMAAWSVDQEHEIVLGKIKSDSGRWGDMRIVFRQAWQRVRVSAKQPRTRTPTRR